MKHGVLNRFSACGWFVCLSADSETQANPVILSSTSYTYDRLGRQLSAIAAGVSTNLFEYDGLDLVAETQNGVVITRATDSLGRSTGLSVAGVGDPSQPYSVTYGYDAYGRFAQVSNFQFQASYTYLGGTDLISGMTASSGHAWTRSYEPNRNLIAAVENTYGSTVISRFDYVNDEIGRRTVISRSGTAFDTPVRDAYGYNARSEVTSARRTLADTPSQEVRGFSYDYAFDGIGNRTSATEYDHEDNARVSSYAANELNQYEQRTVPGYAGVRGSATNTATVTVNGNAAWRLDDYFYGGDDADNAASPVMKELDITAVVNPPGTNTPDLVESITGRVYVAQSPEAFTHDDDGNLLSDGRFTYTWDGENRLIAVATRADLPASVPRVKVTYQYDPRFRRIGKEVSNLEGETWTVAESLTFLYDGWNMIAETSGTNAAHYIWGLDVSGSRQGAGGVGGLLAVVKGTGTYHPAFDGNGNVCEYTDASGTIVAHYEYSPFGETVVQTGSLADAFTFRFSTKYLEEKAKLYYYGYRFYATSVGRWMNRDPVGEGNEKLLYSFCRNDSFTRYDLQGLTHVTIVPEKKKVKDDDGKLMDWMFFNVVIDEPPPSGCHINFLAYYSHGNGEWSLDNSGKSDPYYLQGWDERMKMTSTDTSGNSVLTFADSPGGIGFRANEKVYFYLLVLEVCRVCVKDDVFLYYHYTDTARMLESRLWWAIPRDETNKDFGFTNTSGLEPESNPETPELTLTELQDLIDATVNNKSGWRIGDAIPAVVTPTIHVF